MALAKRYLFFISQNYSFGILRPLQQAILQSGGMVAWYLEGKEVNPDYLQKGDVRLLSMDDVIRFNADANLFPGNIAPTFLPGINVAVFHGFDAGKVDKYGNNDHFKIRNCFDLYCTQGPDSTAKFKALMEPPRSYMVRETGWCALDTLFDDTDVVKLEKPTVLMCSTFSRRLSCAETLFPLITKLSKTGKWQWLIQFHPKMAPETVAKYRSLESEHLCFVETDDVKPLLKQADVMLCDTSSVLLMFLLLNKPVVTFNNIEPKDFLLNVVTKEEVESALEIALTRPPNLMKNIAQYNELNHPYQDGKSSYRVLAAIDECLANKHQLTKKKPDIFRQLKMRKRLGYWKL
ncbi:CDP-glycerol glycerophosphotransferase family protein [Thalassotalea sp. LPB0316]|nr:CDP-glycerol glycerophosphotransferase family protein [Thalassotalea sp. LPB0316]QOL26917.1 CDP-glycerol glycerophosphotransferase family protein [Thalassotalea sp. LPB0316]